MLLTLPGVASDVNPYIPGGGGAQWYGPTNTLCVYTLSTFSFISN